MTVKTSSYLPAASWITEAEEDWTQLAGFGPAGLPGYVRVRILPDPERPFQSENDVTPSPEALGDGEQMRLVVQILAAHTGTPEEAFFCLWDGWDTPIPGFKPMVRIPHRAYYLFEGPLREVGQWQLPATSQTPESDLVPAFVWPADRAWCVAKDVDQHWIGVGAGEAALQDLLAEPRLDVVKADPAEQQPFYL
ncbi:hypothetical protein Kisp01_24050 [Kineosporia sp. NBRC 101677]|uniref:hypothetical protein n=1 Tax=Kineosporia sp. NBRC 101677 TaxID=3032197 RepID=UPI0024A1DE4A|nr:hypothetical protein [Kineosporia sp. NBRC 101677]GLY15390.1 hypothetical protein Kisp01_24050 [Kineosporia sp. NBRC 101677]